MYGWLWRRLPLRTPWRVVILVLLAVGVAALLWYVVFPAVGKRQVFLYVVRGRIAVGDVEAEQFQLVELSPQGDAVEIVARTDAVLLFGHAEPIGEPVVSYGPFVMNTEDEIRQAIADYQAGRFGNVPG